MASSMIWHLITFNHVKLLSQLGHMKSPVSALLNSLAGVKGRWGTCNLERLSKLANKMTENLTHGLLFINQNTLCPLGQTPGFATAPLET